MTETTKPRILLVEDNMDRQIAWPIAINESIPECGLPPIEILQATNVSEAKNRLKKAESIGNLDIIVLDYNFFIPDPDGSRLDDPGGNGADFARHAIRAGFSGTLIAASGKVDLCQEIEHTARMALFVAGRSTAGLTLLSTDGNKSKVPELVIQALQDIYGQSK